MTARAETDGALVRLLLVLTFTTGLVDAVSYLGLGKVFTANMTGNVVFLGFGIAGAADISVAGALVSFGGFVVGAALGGRLGARLGEPRRRWLGPAIAFEVLLVAIAAIVGLGLHAGDDDGRRFAVIALMAGAMGLRNAVVRGIAVPDLTTTVLTMTVTGLAADSPLGAGQSQRAVRRIAAVLAMLIGALVGGLLVIGNDISPALGGIAVLLAVSLLAYGRITVLHGRV